MEKTAQQQLGLFDKASDDPIQVRTFDYPINPDGSILKGFPTEIKIYHIGNENIYFTYGDGKRGMYKAG